MEDLEYHLNENTDGYSDKKNKIFLSISILSWLFFLVTSWLSLGLPYVFKIIRVIWFTVSINYEKNYLKNLNCTYEYIPLRIFYEFHYVIFIFAFSLATIGFIIFMVFRENENIMEIMLGKFTKFHFIPLLFISALFINGESLNFDDFRDSLETKITNQIPYFNTKEYRFIFNFIFTIIALASLIFISLKTKTKSPWYAFLSINKGTYSCLIPLLVYNLSYSIITYVIYKLKQKQKEIDDWLKASGIAFSLVLGIINSVLSFVLKDIMIAFMNTLIYTGMLIYFFKIKKSIREGFNEYADGIIDIVVLTGNVAIIIFLSFQWKKIYKED